ncbi:ATP-dependent DNA ligase [Candidatus Woesearchaeota archaeon]|nr:ATP-dependent DNA ligase [Candidatus Woesearchaeota archaeon]
MQYSDLVGVYNSLSSTSKRLEKTRILSELLKNLKPDEVTSVILLLQGRIFPSWDETKLGIASKLVVKAISKATGISPAKIGQDWKKTGDLGKTAQNMVKKKTQSTLTTNQLTVDKVFKNLKKLAGLEGIGSIDRKIQLIAELLTSAQPESARYIVRTLLQDLRVGVGEGSLRDAIVWAFFSKQCAIGINDAELEIGNREEYNKHVGAVQQAYDITNDFAVVAEIAKKSGLEGLLNQELLVGKPVKVMLALKANDAEEALERVGIPAEAEYKLDGFRIQVHKDKKCIRLFTRRLEDVSAQFPDIVKYVREHIKGNSFIIDSEAVGYSPKTGKYLPFQSISQRIKRKYNIEDMARKFPVELNIFDILYYEKKNLLKEPFSSRRKLLEKIVHGKEKQIVLVRKLITKDPKEVRKFFNESVKAGNEGLMLKNLNSPYKPGARVGHMVKLKATMENLDLVIIGAEWGEGKRAEWLSSYRLACRNEEGKLLQIGKVSTGLKEKEEQGLTFRKMTSLLNPLVISAKGREVKVRPEIIVEIAYEEIQKSPTYSSGFALRFPRIIRLRTEERSAEDITDLDYIEEIYYSQKK